MTIASEITRLQNDKAAMCTAIENKGVTVGNVTFDDYAACIDAIPTGPSYKYADVLVVGGGGNGLCCGGTCCSAGGGGAGGVIHRTCGIVDFLDENNSACVVVGGSGANSCLGPLVAYGGGLGGGCNGGSGGGANAGCCVGGAACSCDLLFQGNSGGSAGRLSNTCYMGGGGGGAASAGCSGGNSCGVGGDGCQYDITGELCYYAAGGGGGFYQDGGASVYGGNGGTGGGGRGGGTSRKNGSWNYRNNATAPTTCGSGGGGGWGAKCGCPGIVVIRYPTDGSYGINCATGGCVYTCNGYTIHCFTSDGTFCILS